MDAYRLRVFLWDQFIRPFYSLVSIHQIKALLLALIIVNFFSFKSSGIFWFGIIALGIIFTHEIIKYWKSGEYMSNYREYKYPDYKRTIKQIKKQKHLNTLNNLNQDETNIKKSEEGL